MKDKIRLRVRKDLCLGCGICAENCPREVISLQVGLAQIDQSRCNRCGICIDVCPQGAITQMILVTRHELQTTVAGLRNRTEEIVARIEALKKK